MVQQAIQPTGGVITDETLRALNSNFGQLFGQIGNPFSTKYYVDGDSGLDSNDGLTPTTAKQTIQAAINAAGQGSQIFIKRLAGDSLSGDTDPDSYAENLTIAAGKDDLQLIGISSGLGQAGNPQIRPGTGSDPLINVSAFGVGIHNLTLNGAGNTGGGIKINADGSAADAGGLVVSGCHLKNLKSSGAAGTGGAIYWTTNGGAWYVSIYNNEFIDCRAGICVLGSNISIPQHVKIVGNRFSTDPNTDVDADIYVATGGVLNLLIHDNMFGTVDVPAYATSPTAARYISLGSGTTGIVSNCTFACVTDPAGTEKTFGAAGTAAIIPTTVRIANCYGEGVVATSDQSLIGRT